MAWYLVKHSNNFTFIDYENNVDITNEVNTQHITELKQNHRSNCTHRIFRMSHSRLQIQILCYQQNGRRFLGRPFKRWNETVTGQWGLRRGRSDDDDNDDDNDDEVLPVIIR